MALFRGHRSFVTSFRNTFSGKLRAVCCSPLSRSTSIHPLPSVTKRLYSSATNVRCSSKDGGGDAIGRTTQYDLSSDGKKLRVSWPDGVDGDCSVYHSVWLRHNCRCPQCWDGRQAAPLIYFDLLRDVKVKSFHVSEDTLHLTWAHRDSDMEHTGFIPLQWLKEQSYSPKALQKKLEEARPVVADHLPIISYTDIMSDEKHVWEWLKNLNLYGLCLITDMPCVRDEVLKLTDRVGGAHATIFGETFHVMVEDDADDVAYSGKSLPYHMDLSGWSEYPPGVQILHCINFDDCVAGGESLILDAYPVLEEMREKHPKQFKILTTYPATFQRNVVLRDGKQRAVERQKPHIILDRHGEITAINLHPNSEGPLSIEEDMVEPYYDAYCLMQEMFVNSKLQHKFRLQTGQAITFNNRRCLHSRTALKLNGGIRYLQGTYLSSDNLKSMVRLFAQKHEPSFILKRTFNLDPL